MSGLREGSESGNRDAAEIVRAALEEIIRAFGVKAEIEIEEDPERLTVRLEGSDLEALVGTRGQTLDAIQHLMTRIAFRGRGSRKYVNVDIAGYRERRAEALRGAADQAAARAVAESRPVTLEPMSALERRVVHEHLKERGDIETYSEGEDPERRLVVAPLVEA